MCIVGQNRDIAQINIEVTQIELKSSKVLSMELLLNGNSEYVAHA